ncbi:LURP-one-related family protein [Streptococcus pneumoniae]
MKQFYIKQKLWSLGGKFTIKDEYDQVCYQVEGSLFKWMKSFKILDLQGQLVSTIQRKFTWFLPRFEVEVKGQTRFVIQKKLSWLKPRYEIENLGLEVLGNIWDMKFDLIESSRVVAHIDQEWFRMTSTYDVAVYDEDYCDMAIALVIAIDYVKAMREASTTS